MRHVMSDTTRLIRPPRQSAVLRLVGLLCLLVATGPTLKAETPVADVRAFGAQGDGQLDDSAAFSKAISAVASQGGGLVLVPPGSYRVPGTYGHRVVLRSQITLRFAPGASLIVGQPAENHYPLYLSSAAGPLTNVVIEHATLIGDPANTNASAGVFIRALSTNLLRNIVLRDLTIRGFSTDGLYIDGTTNNTPVEVRLERVTASGNRRHGLALICADNFLASECVFEANRGFDYSCGADVEPNRDQRATQILFQDCVFTNNRASGLWFNRGSGLSVGPATAVNCLAGGNGGSGFQANYAGNLVLRGVQSHGNSKNGISLCAVNQAQVEDSLSAANQGCGMLLIAPRAVVINGFDSSSNLLHGLQLTRGAALTTPFDATPNPVIVMQSRLRANHKIGVLNSGLPGMVFQSNHLELNGMQGLCLGRGAISNRIEHNHLVGNAAKHPSEAQLSVESGASRNVIAANRWLENRGLQVNIATLSDVSLTVAAGQILPEQMVGHWFVPLTGTAAGERRRIREYLPDRRTILLDAPYNPPPTAPLVGMVEVPRRKFQVRLEKGSVDNTLEALDPESDPTAILDLGSNRVRSAGTK